MRAAIQDVVRETQLFAGIVGALWFACYLYEIGFMLRFGVPPIIADIGFSLPLAVAMTAGSVGALAAALLLLPKRKLAAGHIAEPAPGAIWGLSAITFVLTAVFVEDPGIFLFAGGIAPYEIHPIRLGLGVSLALYTAMFFAKLDTLGRRNDFGTKIQLSLLTLLLILVPVGLGWFGAERKIENKRSFFYLAEQPDYVLVRLYDEKAVFVRYDRREDRFSSEYLIHLLDDPDRAFLTRKPGAR